MKLDPCPGNACQQFLFFHSWKILEANESQTSIDDCSPDIFNLLLLRAELSSAGPGSVAIATMNIFRILGTTCGTQYPLASTVARASANTYTADLSHLVSILILLQKMKSSSVRASALRAIRRKPLAKASPTERIRHILQVSGPLPSSVRNSIPWYETVRSRRWGCRGLTVN